MKQLFLMDVGTQGNLKTAKERRQRQRAKHRRWEQRQLYLVLANLHLPKPFGGCLGLCNMCRYAQFSGSYCSESELECHHPLEVVSEGCDDVWSGDDCWGFRPQYSREDTVDMVGLFLQGQWPDMSQCS